MNDDTKDVLLQCPSLIEGIGPATTQKLHEAGIERIADLISLLPEQLGNRLSSVSVPTAANWQAAARLLLVKGIDKDCAEAFVEAGITSIQELSEAGLQTLERAVKAAVEANRMKEAPSLYRLAGMQRQAWLVRTNGMLTGRLHDSSGAGLAEIPVVIARRSTETDGDGWFCLRPLPPGKQVMTIRLGHRISSIPVEIETGRLSPPQSIQLDPPPPDTAPPKTLSEVDGELVWLQRSSDPRLVSSELDELPDSTYLQVRAIDDDEVRLLHLFRQRIGDEVISQLVRVPSAKLPDGAAVGSVLNLSGDTLTTTELTVREVARMKLDAVIGKRNLKVMRRFIPILPNDDLL